MFERPKDVFDGLPPRFHGTGLSIKSLLCSVHHLPVLPASDVTVLALRTPIPLRTTRARTRSVHLKLEAPLVGGEAAMGSQHIPDASGEPHEREGSENRRSLLEIKHVEAWSNWWSEAPKQVPRHLEPRFWRSIARRAALRDHS